MGAALSTLRIEGSVSWITLTREQMDACGAVDEDSEGVVNYALGIAGVEVALFFRETHKYRIRVSMRSKGAVQVADIAAEFGGGGHECASGFSVEGPMQAAIDKVLARLRKILRCAVQNQNQKACNTKVTVRKPAGKASHF